MRIWWLWAVVWLCIAAPAAHAEKLLVPEIHGESDVADEAGAVTVLVRSALARDPRTLVPAPDVPERLTIATAPPALAKLAADAVVLGELVRDGTGLRATLVIVDREGTSSVAVVHAGDGDVHALAVAAVAQIANLTHVAVDPVAPVGLGRLRPYAVASRAATSGAADGAQLAARALADAIPTTANAAPAVTYRLTTILGKLDDARAKLVAARALAARNELDAIAAGKPGPAATAAHALAAIERADLAGADAALAAAHDSDPVTLLAKLVLADAHSDAAATAALLKQALATGDARRAALAFAARPDAPRWPDALIDPLLGFAEQSAADSPGVASRLGLAAARANVSTARGLALISVRDLEDAEIAALAPLVATGQDATALRLRAELAMRKADGTEAVAIDAYLAAAPDEPRAHLYKGYALMGTKAYDEAAKQFAAAKAGRERAHALLLANDLTDAIAELVHAPVSPEEFVIAARDALGKHALDQARAAIAEAEAGGPASATVMRAIVDVEGGKGSRAELARSIADADARATTANAVATVKITDTPLGGSATLTNLDGSGSGSAANTTTVTKRTVGETDALAALDLNRLTAQLPELGRLPHGKVAIAELAWSPSLFSLRVAHGDRLTPIVQRTLGAAPFKLAVTSLGIQHDRPLEPGALERLLPPDHDALVLYQVRAEGSDAEVSLEVFVRGARLSREVSDTFAGKGLVALSLAKLLPLGLVLLSLILVLAYYAIRGTGTIKVVIERAADASDECFCVVASKSPVRPPVPDPQSFRATTRKAGAITQKRSATLVAASCELTVPPGTWHVHVYGTHVRGGVTLALPDTASREVALKRGTIETAKIDLAPNGAELFVQIEGDQRRGVAVWANDNADGRVHTNDDGIAVLVLPVGNHMIHFEIKGHEFTRDVPMTQKRIYRYPINLARELRLIESGLDASSAPSTPIAIVQDNELELEPEKAASAPGVPAKVVDAKSSPVRFKPASVAPPHAQTQVASGRILDRYSRASDLGRGAMGIVQRAWDENLERDVAIKVMADDLQSHPEALRLFQQEAKALAQLNHTNIVGVYDQVTRDNKTYMIMEFVDGTTLEHMLDALPDGTTLPLDRALEIVEQVCAGLAYAHARRVIHRDVKPANVFIARDGTVKLGDFGLARVTRELTIRRTEIRGTPLYMAPEQITGADLDHRVDLYAVGCTLFELATGRPPFVDGDILYHQLHTPPPRAITLAPTIPVELDEIIANLLAKSANERPASAGDVRTALGRVKK